MYLIRAQEEEGEGNRDERAFFMAFGVSSVGMWEAVLGERLSLFHGHRERQIEVEGGELL